MIEHPVITATERWGYPTRPQERKVICADCGKELTGDDPVFNWDGDQICETCCKTAIEENFPIWEIAEALNITARYAADLED